MRLKENSMVVHANRPFSIDDNSLDRIENNRAPDTTSALSSDKRQWENNYKLKESLKNDENCNLSLKQTDFTFISPADDQDGDRAATSGSSSPSSGGSSPEEGYRSLSSSDSETPAAPPPHPRPRGIINPNYPGFQDFADQLVSPCRCGDHNNNADDTVEANTRDTVQKSFYDKPKFELKMGETLESLASLCGPKEKMVTEADNKMAEAETAAREGARRRRDKMALDLKMGGARRPRDRRRPPPDPAGSFDVYNIETALPKIDMDAIENHLRAAKEQERRRRNDREEIRKRLATGCDAEEYFGGVRPGRKPSLQARLQSGMNLQICFMNETMSDTESPGSDSELGSGPKAGTPVKRASPLAAHPAVVARDRAAQLPTDLPNNNSKASPVLAEGPGARPEEELAAAQARARAALAQAADLARLQMEGERQRRQISPITLIVRNALRKAGVELGEERRRVSRQVLTDMNLAQLQVIVNELHTQIEHLNEGLVEFLMERDDLHMSQDSMLVDIEDLTRYIGAKEDVLKEELNINNNVPVMKPKPYRMAAMRK